jgi:ubiquinone biosynthesis protein COQ9
VEHAAEELGLDPAQAKLAFPKGAADMIDAWFAAIDVAMAAAFSAEELAAMPVHKRIRAAVLKRFEIARPAKEALRRALAILAMPQNMPLAAKLSWRSADAMWRMAGDTATDFNHYTKRGILAGVYGSTIMAWLGDESQGEAETRAFLDRRLGNVADFESFKKKLGGDPDHRFSITRFLGRLRYPGR